LGTYVDEGTEITLTAKSLITGKYDINLKGDEFKFNNETKTEILVDEILEDKILIKLNVNCSLILTISPKTYRVNVNENVYETLQAVFDNIPDTSVGEQDQVNNLNSTGQRYNETAILEFVRNAEDRKLSAIYITGNDSTEMIAIEFDGDRFVAYKIVGDISDPESKDVVSLTDFGFSLEMVGEDKGKLTYTTQNDINIRFDYKMYKIIRV